MRTVSSASAPLGADSHQLEMVGKWQPPALAGGRGDAGGFEAWTLWGEVSGPRVEHNFRFPTFIDLTDLADRVAGLDSVPQLQMLPQAGPRVFWRAREPNAGPGSKSDTGRPILWVMPDHENRTGRSGDELVSDVV